MTRLSRNTKTAAVGILGAAAVSIGIAVETPQQLTPAVNLQATSVPLPQKPPLKLAPVNDEEKPHPDFRPVTDAERICIS